MYQIYVLLVIYNVIFIKITFHSFRSNIIDEYGITWYDRLQTRDIMSNFDELIYNS